MRVSFAILIASFITYSAYSNALITCPGSLLISIGVSLPRPLPIVRQNMNGKCGPSTAGIAASYFGKIWPNNFWNPFELADTMSLQTQRIGYLAAGQLPPPLTGSMTYCIHMNSAANLSLTLRSVGLNAEVGVSTLEGIAVAVASNKVVLIHWTMGQGVQDGHWCAVQGIHSTAIQFRDPWPTSPVDNYQPLAQFYYRALGAPGFFTTVKVSD